MNRTPNKADFDPYHRYTRAMKRILSKNQTQSSDVWENKLYEILKLREQFKQEYKTEYFKHFAESFPLFANLLAAVEDDRPGGDKDLLEAVLLCGADLDKIAEELKHPVYDCFFLGMYKKLCYDITNALRNPALKFQCIIKPMAQADSDTLAIGNIWKLLALAGGISLLKRKGLGTEAIKAEDIEHLLQLASFRHCSTLMQYTASGRQFFADNPATATALSTLVDFDGMRSHGRRLDYTAEISSVAKNNFNSLLNNELKLLSVPDEVVASLVEYDGQFRPDITNALEYTEHVNFLDNGATQEYE